MPRMFVIIAALALVLPTLAAAEEDHHQQGGHPPPAKGHPPPGHPQFKPAPVHPGPAGPTHPLAAPLHPVGPVAEPHFGAGQFTFRGRPFNRVHIAPFVYPSGWAYRRWVVGGILPPLFLARDYWYADWAALGVPPPPPGDQWVRYGPDLLLVDVTTGQVVDVVYGAFYY